MGPFSTGGGSLFGVGGGEFCIPWKFFTCIFNWFLFQFFRWKAIILPFFLIEKLPIFLDFFVKKFFWGVQKSIILPWFLVKNQQFFWFFRPKKMIFFIKKIFFRGQKSIILPLFLIENFCQEIFSGGGKILPPPKKWAPSGRKRAHIRGSQMFKNLN